MHNDLALGVRIWHSQGLMPSDILATPGFGAFNTCLRRVMIRCEWIWKGTKYHVGRSLRNADDSRGHRTCNAGSGSGVDLL